MLHFIFATVTRYEFNLKHSDNGIASSGGPHECRDVGLFSLADDEFVCFGYVGVFLSSVVLVSVDRLQIPSSFFPLEWKQFSNSMVLYKYSPDLELSPHLIFLTTEACLKSRT